MTVHVLGEYVRYHQQKLREQQLASQSSSLSSSSISIARPQLKRGGVNQLHSSSSFKTQVSDASDDQIVVVDFFATWCGPCKAIAPKVADMSNRDQYSNVRFLKIDVDEVPEVAQQEGIRAMPTFIIYKNGEKVDDLIGADPRALQSKIDALLKSIKLGIPYEKQPEPFNIMSYLPLLLLAYLAYTYFFSGGK